VNVLCRGNDVGDEEVVVVMAVWYNGSRLGTTVQRSVCLCVCGGAIVNASFIHDGCNLLLVLPLRATHGSFDPHNIVLHQSW
jgi:hypothetical protein